MAEPHDLIRCVEGNIDIGFSIFEVLNRFHQDPLGHIGGVVFFKLNVGRAFHVGLGGRGDEFRMVAFGHLGQGLHLALDIDDHAGRFRKGPVADRLLHQAEPGAGSGGARLPAAPGSADHSADRGNLVLHLHEDAPLAGQHLGHEFRDLGGGGNGVSGDDRTAILLEIEHRPGALAEAMMIFKRNRLNMTWIESFPIPGSMRGYFFFVEMEAHQSDTRFRKAVGQLQKKVVRLEILGSFPAAVTVE